MPHIKSTRLILASSSPRRADLLSQIGLTFEIYPNDIDEPSFDGSITPASATQQLASMKAKSVAERYTDGVIIGADTLVSFEDKLLGKPDDPDHARCMLKKLSGKKHEVVTGVSLINVEQCKEISWTEATKVYFRDLSSMEIDEYVNCGEPSDKAGAYGIQGRGAAFVNRIEGCYFNVVGLPLASLIEHLSDF
ncbi:septum formation inhibitor Maf [Candidatus Poribacteria bacterium]|nr:septum formation inhibitor Maf [Candidatus Poribacteria bacterium]